MWIVFQASAKPLEAAALTMMQDSLSASPGPVVWALSRFLSQADVADENRGLARKLRTGLVGSPTAFVDAPTDQEPTLTPLWGEHPAGLFT